MPGRNVAAWWLCALVLAGGPVWAADGGPGAAAKAVVAKHAEAIVHLKVVVSTKMTYQGREMPARERETEILGTVLDGSGLIVTSNTAADPSSAQARMAQPGLKIDAQIKGTKLLAKDGTEVPLKIVLRDKDLDLMFLRPDKKIPLKHIGLKKTKGATVALMDQLILLSRLGPVGDRQPSVSVARIEAVVEKPRRMYVTDAIGSVAALGCPAFTAKGKLVGLVVVRVAKGGHGGGLLGGLRSRMLPVVLPVVDLLDDIKQTEEPKKDD